MSSFGSADQRCKVCIPQKRPGVLELLAPFCCLIPDGSVKRVLRDGHDGLPIPSHIATDHGSNIDSKFAPLHQSSRKLTTNKASISEISQLEAEELDVVREAILLAAGELKM